MTKARLFVAMLAMHSADNGAGAFLVRDMQDALIDHLVYKSIVLDLILKTNVLSAVNHRLWSEIIQFKFVIGP